MIKKFLKCFLLCFIFLILYSKNSNAAYLDPRIPTPSVISFSSNGMVYWAVGDAKFKYKSFQLQLLKRTSTSKGGVLTYVFKDSGSVKTQKFDEGLSYEFSFSSVGYYKVKVRALDLEGNYSNWSSEDDVDAIEVTEDDLSIGVSVSISNTTGSYGPGVYISTVDPSAYRNNIIVLPDGTYIYNQTGQSIGNTSQQAMGPGYVVNNQAATTLTPVTNASSAPIVPAPFNINNSNQANQTNTISNTNNVSSNNGIQNAQVINTSNTNNGSGGFKTPNITEGLEIGWHIDENGRYYYQGNGVVLKDNWYRIDDVYYVFDVGGYVIENQWYKDKSSGNWYYLGANGKMQIGWIELNGVWYYLNPNNGNGYGSMYANTSLYIKDAYYGFASSGAMVSNAWFGGYYYGADGKRTK